MAKNTRSAADDSDDELNREEADELGAPPFEAPPEVPPEPIPYVPTDIPEAVPPAPEAAPDVVDSFFDQFKAEEVKLTDACKSWVRRELELFGLGHSAQDRADLNP